MISKQFLFFLNHYERSGNSSDKFFWSVSKAYLSTASHLEVWMLEFSFLLLTQGTFNLSLFLSLCVYIFPIFTFLWISFEKTCTFFFSKKRYLKQKEKKEKDISTALVISSNAGFTDHCDTNLSFNEFHKIEDTFLKTLLYDGISYIKCQLLH